MTKPAFTKKNSMFYCPTVNYKEKKKVSTCIVCILWPSKSVQHVATYNNHRSNSFIKGFIYSMEIACSTFFCTNMFAFFRVRDGSQKRFFLS